MARVQKLFPELEDHLQELSRRLGKISTPVHAYIAGGVAVNFYTGIRMSDDVDIAWSHKIAIPPDMRVFKAENPGDPLDDLVISMDGEFGDYLGSFHPDWKKDSQEICRMGDIVLHVISPLDLAVSKIGRFQDRDKEDIEGLAQFGLIKSEEFEKRAKEAIEYYIGDISFIEYNIRDALQIIRVSENGIEHP